MAVPLTVSREKVDALNLKLSVIEQARDILEKSAAQVEEKALHWIGNADYGYNYCYECALKIVGNDNDDCEGDGPFVDGGWGGHECDSTANCESCGVDLEYSPTDYCTLSEIDHYLDYWNDHIGPGTARYLVKIFEAVLGVGNPLDGAPWRSARDPAGTISQIDDAFILAERTLSAVGFCTSHMDWRAVWS